MPKLLVVCLAAGVILAGAVFWVRYPVPYQPPSELPLLSAEQEHRLFVHGTLRSGLLRWLITGERLVGQPASLAGFERKGLDVQVSDGASVEGQLLVLGGKALERLDRYERLGDRYQRWCMALTEGTQAWVYQRMAINATEQSCGQACELEVCGSPHGAR